MQIKWSKSAVKQLLEIIEYLEKQDQIDYAVSLEKQILNEINLLIYRKNIHQADRIKHDNDGSFYAFEIDSYRISYRKMPDEIRILRIRHISRKPFTK
ncbi:MAG: type II toxin-antitoxin system RelE/ParE family toxin [Sphingobacteriaceae bacterium]|nr:MAG: type II toxin-antitoxin system RelE/ParE family toxin [Sphingobacteriaceae bacterium]